MGPTFNFNKKNNKAKALDQSSRTEGQTVSEILFLFLSFKSSLFDSRSFDRQNSSGQ